jgi:hypothetical protein
MLIGKNTRIKDLETSEVFDFQDGYARICEILAHEQGGEASLSLLGKRDIGDLSERDILYYGTQYLGFEMYNIPLDGSIIERLKWLDGGDGVEYEIYIDTQTKKMYEVPIEITRYFKDAIEINNK